MATVRPFPAWRPPAELSAEIASVPYDVIDTDEARALAAGKPRSFLHVIRPEIDLPAGTDLHSAPVYDQARRTLLRFLAEIPYRTADAPELFVYRLVRNGRPQVGVVGVCAVDEYDDGRIAVHERTRADKEDDRTRHVMTMRCQAEPIFLAYRATATIDALVAAVLATPPLLEFVAEDGIEHALFAVQNPRALVTGFAAVPRLYVADGHHRARSASRARAALGGADEPDAPCNFVLSVVFPDDQLEILPYHRVVTDLGGRDVPDVLAAIGARFPLRADAPPLPTRAHDVSIYAAGAWLGMTLPPVSDDVLGRLDVSRLQELVLAPVFGVTDPRRDTRIDFVGGIRGPQELVRRVDRDGGIAFSMFATSMAELFAVADADAIMPPKSTWFEPKLRSGLFLHRI